MIDLDIEKKILEFLPADGSVSGASVCAALGEKYFDIWQTCINSQVLINIDFAQYYLRIDAKIPGYARLSPSILRDFLTYNRISTLDNAKVAIQDSERKRQYHREVSQQKRETAARFILEALDPEILQRTGVMIAGDVCRDMAHEVERPERSTGEMVRGSDIDLIFIIETDDQGLKSEIENRLLPLKSVYLRHPSLREEIDFIVNSLPHYQDVSKFETPSQMISCKAALEGQYIAGNRNLVAKMRGVLANTEAACKILEMSEIAFSERIHTVEKLRKQPNAIRRASERRLFYFSDEIWEFMLENEKLSDEIL